MDSDFGKAKVGDWAWESKEGWRKITQIDKDKQLPLRVGSDVYYMDGKANDTDKAPSVFLVPPSDFNAGSPPCEFKEGDKVVVWDDETYKWRARFSHYEERVNKEYHCYNSGDRWTSNGKTRGWKHCVKWEE